MSISFHVSKISQHHENLDKGASRKDIRFLGRWVGFQKLDITMLKQSLHWVKIRDGWVGWSKNGQKNRISFMDGPLACLAEYSL